MSDLKFALFVVGLTLLGCGGTLVSLPFPDLWKTVGKIMAGAGIASGAVAAFLPG